MVNTTQKISQSPVPDLEQFRAIAAQKDDRVISKRGEVKEPSTFHKGHKFASVSEGVLRKKYTKFFQENIKTHLDLKQALLKEEKPETALLAYSLVSPSGYRGEPLTERKILEVVSLLDEVKVEGDTYQQLKNTFDSISKDPRMQVSLENQYPGKMDGFGAQLLEMGKEKLKGSGVNAAINLALPGVGLLVATGRELHKASVNGDAEAYHHQLEQISQLPGRDQRLSMPMQQTLAIGHAMLSAEGAVGATLGMATGGLGTFGVSSVATAGVTPIAKEAIGTALATGIISGGGFVAGQAGAYGLNNEVQDQLKQGPMSGVLPRLEISNVKGDFTFSMQEPAAVRALMAYLGPKEDTSMSSPQAPKEAQEMEAARLTLKQMLGSSPNEHLVPDVDSLLKLSDEDMPSQTESTANGAFKKLLSEDWDWLMPAVRAMDKGEANKINEKLTYKLPLDAANGRVYLDKSPNLSDAQLDALDKLGSPSQLRLMYLAEGWI
ncbi:type III secretion system effector VopQ [Vibrio parahaemolyticus]|uniref:type III secretion system effector VopQ n=1 Tax=Vibrio parahaemolyticus TaxID=670 RepID=UPI0003A742D0|nr:type III secretion system effector VopQ [Vibrio parahaemolyticus]AYO04361.1 CesT family type III secretion system chaperone [Vibrio parahaemolyticus]EGQ8064226.1 type III secretion system effector VopQ [Vibrio parahaemolyticus]EGQ9445032.1 type III secretion system effector VopQ [Vibrio parahaemolyticus]EGR3370093.1 cation transporter [Vibrio parahaemolyticus]EHZ2907685.1 type III secretion system effector VopQ [Vibrio parahaemolyticus]